MTRLAECSKDSATGFLFIAKLTKKLSHCYNFLSIKWRLAKRSGKIELTISPYVLIVHFRDQVEEMEQFAASKSSDPRDFQSLREMVTALGTHLTKYPLLMDAIEKWAGKAQ